MKKLMLLLFGSLMALSLTACGPQTMDMTGDFTITYEGANGYATPTLERTYASNTLVNENDLRDYLDSIGATSIFTDEEITEQGFGLLIDYQLDGDYVNLSNDDVIVVNMLPSERMELAGQTLDMIQDEFNLEFVSTTFNVTVQDLPQAIELDISSIVNQYTTVSGSAQEPNITVHFPVGTERALSNGLILNYYDLNRATLIYGRNELGNFELTFDYELPLMEGDIITVTASPLTNEDREQLIKSNCILLPVELPAPALSTAVINPDTITANMQAPLLDAARSYLATQEDTAGATITELRFGYSESACVVGVGYTLPAAEPAANAATSTEEQPAEDTTDGTEPTGTTVSGVLNLTCSITLDGELSIDEYRLSDTFEPDYEWTVLNWDLTQTVPATPETPAEETTEEPAETTPAA